MMFLSNNNGIDNVDPDDYLQFQQTNPPSVTDNPSKSSSPSFSTLLVIDDTSNSNDSSLNKNNIPSNTMPSTAQTTHFQVTSSSPVPPIDVSNDTPEQQRRRNSSIAKLLGGQPLNNQQYEEIHQKILNDQTAQNTTNNNDNGITDTGIQLSRSSLTRTLLMNAERNNNSSTTVNTTAKGRPPSPLFSKDFEYLIRRELDIEHAPSTLNRNSSTPSVFQNLSSARNTPPSNAQSPSQQSRTKRKRPNPKQTVPPTMNKSPSVAPFAIRNPFEIDSPSPSLPLPVNATAIHRPHHHQNDVFHFDGSHYSHHQNQQQYSLPINNSHSFSYPKLNQSSPVYAQYKNHHDRMTKTSPCISSSTSSPLYNCCCYPPTTELALPIPVSSLSSRTSSSSIMTHNSAGTPARKTKVMHTQQDIYEIPVQRSYSTISNQSIISSSSSSSGHSVPLKKRLLHAYTNEQRPSSLL